MSDHTARTMSVRYDRTGAERKKLVQAVSEILDTPSVYLRTPTYGYQIGEYNIDKDGTLTGPENRELVRLLSERHGIAAARAESDTAADAETSAPQNDTAAGRQGKPEPTPAADRAAPKKPEPQAESAGQSAPDLAIEIPLAGFTPDKLDNLIKMVAAKEALLKAALGIDALPIQQEGDRLRFPWFRAGDFTADAERLSHMTLVSLMCSAAKAKKRVTAKEKGRWAERVEVPF